jgi:putative endonuclease
MWFVYILKSLKDDDFYIGSTNNVHRRLTEHNLGNVDSTKCRIPFTLEAYVAVKDKSKAIELEQYLKTGSGRAVLQKRIL